MSECVACKVSGLRRTEAAEQGMNNGSRCSGDTAVKASRVGADSSAFQIPLNWLNRPFGNFAPVALLNI